MDYTTYLVHHGIKGMKWGVRRYQNPDGSLTAAGMRRYLKNKNVSSKDLARLKPWTERFEGYRKASEKDRKRVPEFDENGIDWIADYENRHAGENDDESVLKGMLETIPSHLRDYFKDFSAGGANTVDVIHDLGNARATSEKFAKAYTDLLNTYLKDLKLDNEYEARAFIEVAANALEVFTRTEVYRKGISWYTPSKENFVDRTNGQSYDSIRRKNLDIRDSAREDFYEDYSSPYGAESTPSFRRKRRR